MDDWSIANFKIYVGSFGSYDATIILVFNAIEKNGRLIWDCTKQGGMPNRYRPSVCRG